MSNTKKHIFNLLKPIEPPLTSWDMVYEWLVGKAKFVIMFTQVIIAITFFAKVVLDTLAKNKEKQIESLEEELSYYTGEEKRPLYWTIQNKERNYHELWTKSSNFHNLLTEIYSYIPNIGADISVNLTDDLATIYGDDTRQNFGEIEASLKESPSFLKTDVALTLEQKDFVEGTGKALFNAIIDDKSLYRDAY